MKTHDLIHSNKEEIISSICADKFEPYFSYACSDKLDAWRAAWYINKASEKCKLPLSSKVEIIVSSISGKPFNHQRELLKMLEQTEHSEEVEGLVFDSAVSCWEDLKAQSSCRMVAFRLMIRIGKNYPELINEIESLLDNRFLKGLSPGIKKSIIKRWSQVLNDQQE